MSNQITYTLLFSIDVCKALPNVGEMFNRLNHQLTTLGESKAGLRAQVLRMTATVPQLLTRKEKETLAKASESALQEQFPDFAFRCDSVRRKSRKSCSQSA